MRIPTLLGLTTLITAVILAVMFQIYQQESQNTAMASFAPQNLRFTNLTDSSFTVTWISSQPVVGSVGWGTSNSLGNFAPDDRDNQNTTPRYTHSATISGLTPSSTYFLKLRNGPFFYPEQALTIKTLPKLELAAANPIVGRILNTSQQGIEDALVYLEIPGANSLSSFTTTAGNFVLPLSPIRNADGVSYFNLNTPTTATLQVVTQSTQSQASLKIPTQKPLPPITLGQNLDLTALDATFSGKNQ